MAPPPPTRPWSAPAVTTRTTTPSTEPAVAFFAWRTREARCARPATTNSLLKNENTQPPPCIASRVSGRSIGCRTGRRVARTRHAVSCGRRAGPPARPRSRPCQRRAAHERPARRGRQLTDPGGVVPPQRERREDGDIAAAGTPDARRRRAEVPGRRAPNGQGVWR